VLGVSYLVKKQEKILLLYQIAQIATVTALKKNSDSLIHETKEIPPPDGRVIQRLSIVPINCRQGLLKDYGWRV
jgi:hypothetical protein